MQIPTSLSAYSILLAGVIFHLQAATACAVQWRPLATTGRYEVSMEAASVRITNHGRIAAWLRFTPLGESQRRQAAEEHGHKAYRLHLEYYEIDCSEQSHVLGRIDILGAGGKRIARMKGNDRPEATMPGSVLDLAAKRLCPAIEDYKTDDEDSPDSEATKGEKASPAELSDEQKAKIAEAISKTVADPTSLSAWRELGNAYFDTDLPQQAIDAYNKALAIAPDDADILNDQGAMFRLAGDANRALINFEKACKIAPYNLESLYNLAFVHAFDLNRPEKAVEFWRRYLTLDKTSETARQVQGFIERYAK